MRANFVIKAIRVIHYDIIENKNSNKLFEEHLYLFKITFINLLHFEPRPIALGTEKEREL